ncbi:MULTISPECIES: DUF6502 family protein [unclassified Mesorhizobium]|uniref:DUF6502 family protein n=1 Tax=unclassified Mesorhizobium TaxID=325217 RepID=UPI0015E2CAF8|nr:MULTISPECIES: DUF6502 family protein [unclassified Mesorhizobium]
MSKSAEQYLDAAGVQSALNRVLRPLVRLAIKCGVTFPTFVDLLRQIYVNVAEHEFTLPDKQQTDSRVSLLTGVHRKEVSRLRGAGAPVRVIPESVSRTSAIVARWLADPLFTDAKGAPLPLPRMAEAGEASFAGLVESVTRDLRPRAVLDDWLDRKLVEIDEEDRIVLMEAAIAPRDDGEVRLYYFARNLQDHAAAAVANILADKPPFIERAVHYDGLSEDLARSLEAYSRKVAMETLIQLNKHANQAVKSDPGGTNRWNCGVYILTSDGASFAGEESSKPAGGDA